MRSRAEVRVCWSCYFTAHTPWEPHTVRVFALSQQLICTKHYGLAKNVYQMEVWGPAWETSHCPNVKAAHPSRSLRNSWLTQSNILTCPVHQVLEPRKSINGTTDAPRQSSEITKTKINTFLHFSGDKWKQRLTSHRKYFWCSFFSCFCNKWAQIADIFQPKYGYVLEFSVLMLHARCSCPVPVLKLARFRWTRGKNYRLNWALRSELGNIGPQQTRDIMDHTTPSPWPKI